MKSSITKLLKSRLFRHILFILVIFVMQIIQTKWIVDEEKFVGIYWLFVVKDTVSDLTLFYTISYFIVPNLTKTHLYPALIVAALASYLFGYGSNYIMFRLVDEYNAYSKLALVGYATDSTLKVISHAFRNISFLEGIFNGTVFYINLTWYGSIVFSQIILKAIKDFYTLQLKNISNQKNLIRLELDFLKTQINPHFLFNTLNNVYSMIAYKDKLAADSILRLSDMMRYSLYETNQEKVALTKEVEFIENYLNLEKIRHGKYVEIVHEISGDLTDCEIAPFLLIILIENAFKHGILPAPQYTHIEIKLIVEKGNLLFSVINTVNTSTSGNAKSGGVGLKNLNRRLSLLYPNTHTLTIEQTDTLYKVQLSLEGVINT
jgi:two-component system, LytTR family, sensor kinase